MWLFLIEPWCQRCDSYCSFFWDWWTLGQFYETTSEKEVVHFFRVVSSMAFRSRSGSSKFEIFCSRDIYGLNRLSAFVLGTSWEELCMRCSLLKFLP